MLNSPWWVGLTVLGSLAAWVHVLFFMKEGRTKALKRFGGSQLVLWSIFLLRLHLGGLDWQTITLVLLVGASAMIYGDA